MWLEEKKDFIPIWGYIIIVMEGIANFFIKNFFTARPERFVEGKTPILR